MDAKEIILGNRYKVMNRLVEIEKDKYKFVPHDPEEAKYMRVGLRDGYKWEDKEYYFFDPSGGPFVCIGAEFDELPGKEVSRIYDLPDGTLIVEFKEAEE
jgi:hypothetical protein